MKTAGNLSFAALLSLSMLVGAVRPLPAYSQDTVTSEPPQPPTPRQEEPCPKGKRGGAIGGIVVGSVFWWLLPMSIPVLITQTKKLKAHNRAQHERRCQYATPQ
jgi:hypothetical protein